jgi:large subunit ribosomal protein L15
MLNLKTLKPSKGARRGTKRLGRGVGSGQGNTSGKGHKGLLARKGGGRRIGYEGGQTPLIRRIPKRGFHNFTKKHFALINLDQIEKANLKVVTIKSLQEAGLVRASDSSLKVLGRGELTRAVSVSANVFSETAKAKIEKAGGKAEVIDVRS